MQFLLRRTIYVSNAGTGTPMEQNMSKRLFTSAIVATLMMAGASIYSTVHQDHDETASVLTMMGG
ncbi:hypothetical protein C8024_01750 [Sphingopyxis sp. BSNA05]|nr:hypothetical protein CHN51_17450 [Sphingorhabdus sp. YGSMI21]NRD88457.1 hypothetical protein [Sphingopyxis sp. BSNA05]